MTAWAWHYQYGSHIHFTKGSVTFKHVTRNLTKNQNFSKILFAFFQVKPEASKSYIKHFSICNIKGVENFSWSLPVHLFQESLDNCCKSQVRCFIFRSVINLFAHFFQHLFDDSSQFFFGIRFIQGWYMNKQGFSLSWARFIQRCFSIA